MMTDRYTQTIECEISREDRRKQLISILLFLVGLALIAVAGVVNWFILIPACVFWLGGGAFLHWFNMTPKEFIYDFSHERLVIARKDAVNRAKRVLTLSFDDVISFEILTDIADKYALIAVERIGDMGVYEIVYKEGDKVNKVCFKPDDYMIALINERLLECRKTAK